MVENGAFDKTVRKYIKTQTQESLSVIISNLRNIYGRLTYDQMYQAANMYFMLHTGAYVKQVLADAEKEKDESDPT